MKRIIPILLLALTVLSLSSCRKSGVNLFAGDYTFKTSGEVSIQPEAEIQGNNITIPVALNVSIIEEIGQLNISASDKGNGEVIVVINYLNGDVVTTTGTCKGNTIELDEFYRNSLPISISTWAGTTTAITVGGTGKIYDNDMIVFNMTYKGKGLLDKVSYIIEDKDIKMVAYRN